MCACQITHAHTHTRRAVATDTQIMFSFFPPVFVLANDLLFSGFSLFLLFLVCFGNAYDFVVAGFFFECV